LLREKFKLGELEECNLHKIVGILELYMDEDDDELPTPRTI